MLSVCLTLCRNAKGDVKWMSIVFKNNAVTMQNFPFHCHRPWLACQSIAPRCWKDVRKTGSIGSVWLKSVRKGSSTAWCDPNTSWFLTNSDVQGFTLCKPVSQNLGKLAWCLKGQMRCFMHGKWPKMWLCCEKNALDLVWQWKGCTLAFNFSKLRAGFLTLEA